jgi:hypothetical protein
LLPASGAMQLGAARVFNISDSIVPLVMRGIVLVASLISLRLGLSVAIIEILFGAVGGAFGLHSQPWMV